MPATFQVVAAAYIRAAAAAHTRGAAAPSAAAWVAIAHDDQNLPAEADILVATVAEADTQVPAEADTLEAGIPLAVAQAAASLELQAIAALADVLGTPAAWGILAAASAA